MTFFIKGLSYKILYMSRGEGYDNPLTGVRRTLFQFMTKLTSSTIVLLFGYKITHEYKYQRQVDYSKYLGPNWKKNEFKGKRVSTIVSNHIGIIDIFACLSGDRYCSFTPGSHVKKF